MKQHGTSITKEDLSSLLAMGPRRHRLSDPSWYNLAWSALYPPTDQMRDWCVTFPFFETFCPAFDEFCSSRSSGSEINRLPFERQGGERVSYTYLKNADESQLNDIGNWIKLISTVVGIRDFLRVSFALDYTCESGDPNQGLTEIANLRRMAKLYGASDQPSTAAKAAACRLAEACIQFIQNSRAYNQVDSVLAVPRADLSKTYSLPVVIAEQISKDLHLADLSGSIKTIKARREMKNTPANDRLRELEGSFQVDATAVTGKRILIVDDLYQSGTTINYVGMLLLDSRASSVFGLCCEKTCSNQDNQD